MPADAPVSSFDLLVQRMPTEPGPVTVSEQAVQQRLVDQLYLLGPSTLLTAGVAALTLSGVFFWLTGRWQALAWGALVVALLALRLSLMRLRTQRHAAAPAQPPQDDARLYVLPLLPYALLWGLGPWLLLEPGHAELEHSLALILGFFSVLAGSEPIIAGWRPLIWIWLLPVSAGIASRFAWQGGTLGWFGCACALIFCGAMARFALAQHASLSRGLAAQIEKEALSEQLMAQSRDLQRLHRERSRFFASASHDLRQPIHALALFSRSLQRDLHGHPSLPVAERVVEATDAVSGLLNAMLDISKIEAGAVQPVFVPVAIDEVFLRLAQIHGERAEAGGLSLRFHTGAELIVTDADLVFRVLSNYVDNAIKYCERGGVLVSARPRGDWLRLAVWDTGRGIRAEHMPLLFDEFYQVDNAHRDIANGLGIGLAIVKRLAALLHARVGLRSVPGRGSVFWLDLPRHAVALPPGERPRAAEPATAGPRRAEPRPRVLVLDDERAVGDAMRIWLAPHCERIDVAPTLEAAQAQLAAAGQVDVLIVDFRLAGPHNGIEAARLLREQAGWKVPAILVTGDTDPARVRAAYESGLVVLFKPVQPEHLLETVRTVAQAAA